MSLLKGAKRSQTPDEAIEALLADAKTAALDGDEIDVMFGKHGIVGAAERAARASLLADEAIGDLRDRLEAMREEVERDSIALAVKWPVVKKTPGLLSKLVMPSAHDAVAERSEYVKSLQDRGGVAYDSVMEELFAFGASEDYKLILVIETIRRDHRKRMKRAEKRA